MVLAGSRKDVEYWISEFNNLVESIKIDEFKYGPRVNIWIWSYTRAIDHEKVF